MTIFSAVALGAPPYSGTIFVSPNIITPADPTDFTGATYKGQGYRWMFDRRRNTWVNYNAYLFDATFADGRRVEVQVNPEFGSVASARNETLYYLPGVGRTPRAVRTRLLSISIHRGDQPFGGGNDNLLIHTGSIARDYIQRGILEEVFVHELSHTSLDPVHGAAAEWQNAQRGDGEYISTYARDYPHQEDVAETFLMWLAVRHAQQRVSPSVVSTVQNTVPWRLSYFDSRGFDLRPYR